jgi:flagellar hook-associated protein 3 FlgL
MNIPGIQIFNTNPEGSVDQVLLENRKTENQNRESPPTQNKTDDKNSEPLRRLASEKFGEKSDIPNANIFDELKSLRIGLLTGDQNAIRGTLDRFDELLAKVVSSRSKIGSRIQGIQGNITAMERHNVTNAQLSSGIEDADMTQIVSDMAKEETIFKSSLASSKHLIQPTLLDFLR